MHDCCKRRVIDALAYRIAQRQVKVYGFVIMPNHMHLIWKISDDVNRNDFQRDFLKYTAKGLLAELKANYYDLFLQTKVSASDRAHQVWEKDSMYLDLYSDKFFNQKLDYIHHNPLQPHWNLAAYPEAYLWSSASFYLKGDKRWGFLTHCDE